MTVPPPTQIVPSGPDQVEDLLLRDGLIRLLSTNGLDVAAGVDTAPAFLEAVDAHRPDVAVVDVRLPPAFTDEGLP